jgi:hypothetical protein
MNSITADSEYGIQKDMKGSKKLTKFSVLPISNNQMSFLMEG